MGSSLEYSTLLANVRENELYTQLFIDVLFSANTATYSKPMIQARPAATYALPTSARAMDVVYGTNNKVEFLVGTSSPADQNNIHMFEYDEEADQLHNVFNFTHSNEITSIVTSPTYHDRCFTTYIASDSLESCASLWKFPSLNEADSMTLDLTQLCSLKLPGEDTYQEPALTSSSGPLPSTTWSQAYAILTGATGMALPYLKPITQPHFVNIVWNTDPSPASAAKCLAASTVAVALYDLEKPNSPVSQISQSSLIPATSSSASTSVAPISHCLWHSQREGNVFLTAAGSSVTVWDARSMCPSSSLTSLHTGSVTAVDMNPNRPYTLATGGADGGICVWDLRQPHTPLVSVRGHTHHVTDMAYNNAYDQVLLTAGTDANIHMWSLPCASSTAEPSRTAGVKGGDGSNDRLWGTCSDLVDRVERVMWCSEWSFCALSADGRVAVAQVPLKEKYQLLL